MSCTPPTPTQAEIDAALARALLEPQTATVDGVTVTQRSVADLIALDKYLAAKKSAHKNCGLTFCKIVPPGAI